MTCLDPGINPTGKGGAKMPHRDQNRNAHEGVRGWPLYPRTSPESGRKVALQQARRNGPPDRRRAGSGPVSPRPPHRLECLSYSPTPANLPKGWRRLHLDSCYWPSGRHGSENGVGSGASGSGVDTGAIGAGAGAGFGAALRGAAFFATGFGAAFIVGFGAAFARAFVFWAFFPFAADLRAATFLRAPFAAALPRAFPFVFLLVVLAMLLSPFVVPSDDFTAGCRRRLLGC